MINGIGNYNELYYVLHTTLFYEKREGKFERKIQIHMCP